MAAPLEKKAERLAGVGQPSKGIGDRSLTGELTDLPNRRYLKQRLRDEMALAKRLKIPLGCIIIDLDHFKPINDRLGHHVGDWILRSIRMVLCETERDNYVVGRFAGEEFFLFLPQINRQTAIALAECLRKKIEDVEIRRDIGTAVRVTISLGVTTFDGEEINEEEMLRGADEALYQSRFEGGNCVRSN